MFFSWTGFRVASELPSGILPSLCCGRSFLGNIVVWLKLNSHLHLPTRLEMLEAISLVTPSPKELDFTYYFLIKHKKILAANLNIQINALIQRTVHYI
jgi:hypothetical protein